MPSSSSFSLNAILSLTDDLTRPYKKTTTKIIGLNNRMGRSFQTLNRGITRGLKIAAGVGLAAVGAGLVIATREFIALDDSITQAGAKFKDLDTTSETYKQTLKELSTAARDVGKVTEFSAVDAAGALDKFAMSGFTSAQAMTLLMGTTNLATAAGTDLTTAVDIATDTLGAFNLVTDDTIQLEKNLSRVSNVMAKTTTTANTSLAELFEAVGKGGAVFESTGQDIETFSTLAGILANSSIKGGEAGTALRNVMLRLSKPTGEAADIIKDLGIQTADSEGNFNDIVDIIGDFEKGLEGMGNQQRSAALKTVFGDRAITSFNILLAKGSDGLRTYREELKDNETATLDMANAMRQSLGNRIKVIKSGLTELGLQFVESFEVDGKNALDALTQGIQNFDMKPVIETAQRGFEIIKKWGPVLLDLAPAILGAVGAIKVMNFALNASPIGIFVASVTALLTVMTALENKFGFAASIVEESGGGIGSRAFEENRRKRFAESERGQNREASVQAGIIQRQKIFEESTQRNDIFLNAPPGFGISTTPGGAPKTAVNLGAQ